MTRASASTARATTAVHSRSIGGWVRSLARYWMFAPALALVVTFKVIPLIAGVTTSLTKPLGVFDSEFVGLENYSLSLDDSVWIESFGNLAKLMLALPVFVLVPLLTATALYWNVRGWKFFRAVFFLSWLLPPVAVGLMFNPIFGLDGPVNQALALFGIEPIIWLGEPDLAIWVLGAVILWSWFGLGTAIYLAGLATLRTDLIDAAKIDGAGARSVLRWVIYPHLIPTMAYWTVLCTASVVLGLFAFVYSLTGGGPAGATTLPDYRIWTLATRYTFQPGYTSALGIELFVVVAVITVIQIRVMFLRNDQE